MEFSIPDKKVEDERISIYVVSRSDFLFAEPFITQIQTHYLAMNNKSDLIISGNHK